MKMKPLFVGLLGGIALALAGTVTAQSCHAPHCADRYVACLADPGTTTVGCERLYDRCIAEACA